MDGHSYGRLDKDRLRWHSEEDIENAVKILKSLYCAPKRRLPVEDMMIMASSGVRRMMGEGELNDVVLNNGRAPFQYVAGETVESIKESTTSASTDVDSIDIL